ncbi:MULTISPECIES: thioredoxin domain-containing protein [unclassified Haladaptatus]|uniref:thioredoxin domain-containing protein n=1 Tax=unclassified Haladaptatus TaxID=2622732 RepID=UPI0023E8280C|nr:MULTISPECIES: thioredoxin domain-containing protein [unclassified Haladaptatus]
MDDPTGRNRLSEEESPYLRQHAENPVNWQPWDDDALDAARERDVPIFLSIGYSACHWCHVMEEESFEDEEVAELMNEKFVPIKVDREERPDLDRIYQTIGQLVTAHGGWPLSVWLTPQGKPFYVGTYFPKEPRGQMPGFLDLLDNIAHSWETDREEIENRATQWTAALTDELEDVPDQPGEAPGPDFLEMAANAALRGADREHGGFGSSGPKFPQTTRLDLLFRAYERTGRDAYREVALENLDAMTSGGLYDHVGGGFHRYVVDQTWTVPHFEKMLYDNAEIPRALLWGYQVTGNERYADVVRETFEFVERELTHDEGGFFSTLDAQSEGEEGKFYVWTRQQVRDAVEDEAAANVFIDRFGVTKRGNFEGTTVLGLAKSIADIAEKYDLSEAEVEEKIEEAREQVFAARADRVRPARDEKVLASWNGMMISAFAEGGLVLADQYTHTAERALAFVKRHLWDAETQTLSRRFKDGDVKGDGYLEDYAFLGRGAFDLYQATGDVAHLAFALELARAIDREFWDEERGALYFTPESGEALVTRPQELGDQSTPSSVGVALSLFQSLSHFAPDEDFGEKAERVIETHSSKIQANPLQYGTLGLAADRVGTGDLELTVVADDLPAVWRARIVETYLPNRILARRPASDAELDAWLSELGLDETPSIWADRTQRDGEPTIYVCRSFTCSPPQTDIEAALDWVDELGNDA